jgi:hypothetical protein
MSQRKRWLTVHKVKDGSRTLQFDGALLAESSSQTRNSNRWIEFALYKTTNGSYVLSRVGVSLVFHSATCPLVKKYKLKESSPEELSDLAVPCEECYPDRDLPIVFPEKDRTWAQVSEEPSAVLEALYKYDYSGAMYLTNVARRLLEMASDQDAGIESVYRVEMIP